MPLTPEHEPLLTWLENWKENIDERFFELDNEDDAAQFAYAMGVYLPRIVDAVKDRDRLRAELWACVRVAREALASAPPEAAT